MHYACFSVAGGRGLIKFTWRISLGLLTLPWRVYVCRFCQVVISAVGKEKCLECQCQTQASLHSSQLFPFPSTVLTMLENYAILSLYLSRFPQFGGNDAAKGKTWEITEYKLSKAVIQNCLCGTYTVLPAAERLSMGAKGGCKIDKRLKRLRERKESKRKWARQRVRHGRKGIRAFTQGGREMFGNGKVDEEWHERCKGSKAHERGKWEIIIEERREYWDDGNSILGSC